MADEEWSRRFEGWQIAHYGIVGKDREIVMHDDMRGWEIHDHDGMLLAHGSSLDSLLTTLAKRPAPKPPTLAEDWETVKATDWREMVTHEQEVALDSVGTAMRKHGAVARVLIQAYLDAGVGSDEEDAAIAAIDEWIAGREGK